MGVEKQIRNMIEKPSRSKKRVDEADAKEFAQEVLQILRSAERGPLKGESQTEAERLAAVLSFMRCKMIECWNQAIDFPSVHRFDDPRQRVAFEAGQMLHDIMHQQRHPIHKFFRGLLSEEMPSRQTPRREFFRRSVLMACVRALKVANAMSDWNRAKAIRVMQQNKVLAAHIPDADQLSSFITRNETSEDPNYKGQIAEILDRMSRAGVTTTDGIIAWTVASIEYREAPLDMETATRVDHIGVAMFPKDGGPPQLLRPAVRVLQINVDKEHGSDAEFLTASQRAGEEPSWS